MSKDDINLRNLIGAEGGILEASAKRILQRISNSICDRTSENVLFTSAEVDVVKLELGYVVNMLMASDFCEAYFA